MRWTKLKSELEKRLAPDLAKRVGFHSTRYGNCSCGRAWITIDKVEVANMCTRAFYNKKLHGVTDAQKPEKYETLAYGEYSRQDFYKLCFDFLNMDVQLALKSDEPLIQALAILDSRTGKRTLLKLEKENLHPLPHLFLQLRNEKEMQGTSTEQEHKL